MSSDRWKTSISAVDKDRIGIKGYSVTEMMAKLSFSDAVFLLLKGELPSESQSRLFNAVLVATIDHGPTPPSVLAARTVASAGNPLNAAIAGGVLAIGDTHGGAIEEAARILQYWAERTGKPEELAEELLDALKAGGKRMPGFGHQLHETDPRTIKLFDMAEETGVFGKHVKLCLAIESALEERLGKKLPININGAVAAVLSDMGFDWRLGKGIFVVSRVPGLLAHAFEEMTRERPMRKLGPPLHEYDGPPNKDL